MPIIGAEIPLQNFRSQNCHCWFAPAQAALEGNKICASHYRVSCYRFPMSRLTCLILTTMSLATSAEAIQNDSAILSQVIGPVKQINYTVVETRSPSNQVRNYEGSVEFNSDRQPIKIREIQTDLNYSDRYFDQHILTYNGRCLVKLEDKNIFPNQENRTEEGLPGNTDFDSSVCLTYNMEYHQEAYFIDLREQLGNKEKITLNWKGYQGSKVMTGTFACASDRLTCTYKVTGIGGPGGNDQETAIIRFSDQGRISAVKDIWKNRYNQVISTAVYNSQGWRTSIHAEISEDGGKRLSTTDETYTYSTIDAQGNWTQRNWQRTSNTSVETIKAQVKRTILYR